MFVFVAFFFFWGYNVLKYVMNFKIMFYLWGNFYEKICEFKIDYF